MKKQLLLLIGFILITFGSYGQTWNQYKKEAKKALEKQEYYTALSYLDTMQKIDSVKFDLYFLQAEAAKYFNAFELAADNYNKILENDQATEYIESIFGLASVLKMQGKYNEAIQAFNNYLVINPDSTSSTYKEARAEIQACKWAIELTKIYDKDLVIQHLKSAVNTDFSDFSPFPYQDKLLLSSLRFLPEGKKKKTNKKYSKILSFQEDGTLEPFALGLSDEETHTAHITFNKEGNQLFFSVCEYVAGSKIECKIYSRKKVDASTWGPPQILSGNVNQEGATSTQPAIGYDENLDKEILFFVSDRKDGLGGTDLWMTYLDSNGKTSSPLNIKQLNTPKDEQSPFFHNYTQTLYFSSNGRISLGGHDVYKSALRKGKWDQITHTGFPLNSSYNDVDFTLNHIGSEGYFASNRKGTRFLDKQISACCYDIFKAEFNSYLLDLNVLTYLKGDVIEDLSGVKVSVYEIFDNAEQEKFYKVEPVGNNHFFSINSNKKYRVVAEKENFFPTEFEFDTKGKIDGDIVIQKAYLQPLKLNVLTFTDEPPQAANEVLTQLFELDKDSNIIKEIKLLENPVGNSHFFPLLSNKTYKITGKKGGYDEGTLVFNTSIWESKTPILTKELILKNIEETIKVPDLIPFALFFDNNLPLPDSSYTTTNSNFSDAIEAYKKRKEEFEKEYAKGFSGTEKAKREAAVTDFFEVQMDTSYTEFLKFTNSTLRRLKFGRFITITVTAYASPLASNAYNLALTKRRISSILNFYKTYKNGEMEKYVNSGSVQIILEPLGESKAPKEISDNPNDKQNSVFSPQASQQRRVVVIGAESTRNKKKPSTKSLE